MLLRLINRRITIELIRYTLLSLCALSALLMLVGAMLEGSRRGLDPFRIIQAMPYLIPPTMPFTVPTCVLFACVFVYGGMAANNEITAIKSAGIHLLRILQPAFCLAVIAVAAVVVIADKLVPYANRRFAEWVVSDMEGMLYSYLSTNGSFAEPGFPYEIYVQSVRDGRLMNTTIVRHTAEGGHDLFAQAAEASISIEKGPEGEDVVNLRMIDGVATTNKDGSAHFNDQSFKMPVPKTFKSAAEKSEALTFEECRAKARERRATLQKIRWELAMLASHGALGGNLEPFCQRLATAKPEAKRIRHKAVQAQAEVPFRVALSTSALPFVLLGCPISVVFRRRDFLQAFFLCFLPICLLYYPLLMLGYNVYQETGGSQVLWLWAPAASLVVPAIPMLRHAIRY